MTHNNHENLSMMDAVTTKYGKTTFVTITKTLAIILVVIFFICLAATGLLVYSFSSTCPANETHSNDQSYQSEHRADASVSTAVVCDNLVKSEVSSTVKTTTTTTTTINVTTSMKVKDKNIRLPRHIWPHSYSIKLIPFIEENNFTFHGTETILFNVTEPGRNITLHASELSIDELQVNNAWGNRVLVRTTRMVKDNEFLVIELDSSLEIGKQYYLDIKFKGVLNDMLEGFYRSSYVENNVTKWLAATQFQATDARKAFPCWDEPAFKAKFQISIARLKNMTAISNMPKFESLPYERHKDYILDRFEESLPMSTYLVAFVVSDFKNISSGIFNIWARPSALSQTKYALEIGPKILKYYEKFFAIAYPLPKVDMVALPDFSAGAMENWGLITYREPALLYEKGVSSTYSKREIAHVVAHELAHQWFGNLVTPVWWEDLWLNEGFATYVEYLGSYSVNPKWRDLDLFTVNELHETFKLDALKTSHAISVKVNDPDEVGEIFDRISYSKGASLIRMMKSFLGDKTFYSGLHKYLKKSMYKNAAQDDLWASLTEQAIANEALPKNATVKEIMDTWTLQVGYPVVTARRQGTRNLILNQERYFLDKNVSKSDTSTWWIPVTLVDSIDRKSHSWMKKEKQIVMRHGLTNESTWYLVNVQQNGYYRVNYDEDNWMMLTKQMQGNGHRLIHVRNRAQLIDDALKLAFSGYLKYEVALNATLYLAFEREYFPWQAAISNFQFLYNMFVRSGYFDKFKVYMIALLKDFYNELTFHETANEDPYKILVRRAILEFACRLGMKDCVLQSVQHFQNWRNSANPDEENEINTDLRAIIYCTAISDGGQDEWEFAWNRYLNSNVASDKETLLSALSCSKEVWILSRYLEWSITEKSGIRKHDVPQVFAAISENPIGQDLAYRFLKANWKRIRQYLGPSSTALSVLVTSCTRTFNTEEAVSDFKYFFERSRADFGIATRSAQQAIEQGEANVRWMAQYFSSINAWLNTARVI